MRRTNLVVAMLAVVALRAAAACWAEPSGRNIYLPYGETQPTQVTVDPGTWDSADSTTRAVEAVASNNRARIGTLEGKVGTLEDEFSKLQTPPTETTPPGTPPPPGSPASAGSQAAGGNATVSIYGYGWYQLPDGRWVPPTTPPATPIPAATETRRGMNPWNYFVMFMFLAIVGVVAAIVFMYIIPAIRRRRMEDEVEVGEMRRRLNNAVIADSLTALDGVTVGSPDDFPAEEYSGVVRGLDGVVARRKGKRTAADTRRMVGTGGGTGGPAAPRATGREYAPAIASLARPTSAVPAGAPAVAAPRVIANSDANRDALATALVGIAGTLTDAVVDALRDAMIADGRLTP